MKIHENRWLAFMKRDLPYLVVIMFCLFGMIHTLGEVQTFEDQCNNYYQDLIEEGNCVIPEFHNASNQWYYNITGIQLEGLE